MVYYETPFAIGWGSVFAPGSFEWNSPTPGVPGTPPNFTAPHGVSVRFDAITTGVGVLGEFYGITTKGSTSITGVTGASDIAVGQLIDGGLGVPVGSRIVSISGSTIVFGNGEWSEDLDSYLNTQPATSSIGGVWFGTVEDYPLGTLQVVVTPDTGVTITDWNADGTGQVISEVSNGSAMANLSRQAEGYFGVVFASAGIFTVTVEYTAADGNFPSNQFAPTITVTVT